MLKYRHKLDYYKIRAAVLLEENAEELADWVGSDVVWTRDGAGRYPTILINTPYGITRANPGDYIFQQGQYFHVRKAPAFNLEFEPV